MRFRTESVNGSVPDCDDRRVPDLVAVYISDLVEHIIILPKKNIPPEIMMERFTYQAPGYLCTEEPD